MLPPQDSHLFVQSLLREDRIKRRTYRPLCCTTHPFTARYRSNELNISYQDKFSISLALLGRRSLDHVYQPAIFASVLLGAVRSSVGVHGIVQEALQFDEYWILHAALSWYSRAMAGLSVQTIDGQSWPCLIMHLATIIMSFDTTSGGMIGLRNYLPTIKVHKFPQDRGGVVGGVQGCSVLRTIFSRTRPGRSTDRVHAAPLSLDSYLRHAHWTSIMRWQSCSQMHCYARPHPCAV